MDVGKQLAATSLEHALDCKKGGLVTQRHNEVRDVISDLASISCLQGSRKGTSRARGKQTMLKVYPP